MENVFFDRQTLERLPTSLLRNGRAANACVTCVTYRDSRWTVKDFSTRSWPVRNLIAPFLLRHELNVLTRLRGIGGIAPQAFAVDKHAIAISYAEGTPLSQVEPQSLSVDFFRQMENILSQIHRRGIAHLDTRGTGNWIVSPEKKPLLIDFQSALVLDYFPKKIREIIELIDLSGVYKKWAAWQPETMGQTRRELFEKGQMWRQRWILRGYFGKRKESV